MGKKLVRLERTFLERTMVGQPMRDHVSLDKRMIVHCLIQTVMFKVVKVTNYLCTIMNTNKSVRVGLLLVVHSSQKESGLMNSNTSTPILSSILSSISLKHRKMNVLHAYHRYHRIKMIPFTHP